MHHYSVGGLILTVGGLIRGADLLGIVGLPLPGEFSPGGGGGGGAA